VKNPPNNPPHYWEHATSFFDDLGGRLFGQDIQNIRPIIRPFTGSEPLLSLAILGAGLSSQDIQNIQPIICPLYWELSTSFLSDLAISRENTLGRIIRLARDQIIRPADFLQLLPFGYTQPVQT
jgi:hypothetical protein